jgi:glycosyltransferase involved in cell wall biosynthesis
VKALDEVVEFLESDEAGDDYFRRAAEISVEFPGRLDHEELSLVLPTWDVAVAPSVLAEAFGMVGAEAAASGVLPVLPRHSGIGEIGSALEGALERPGLLTFDPADPVRDLAAALDRLLSLGADERLRMDAVVSAYAHEHWSWEKVGDGLLAAAMGR